MPRPTQGYVVERPWADGKTVSYGAQVRAYGRYEKVTFGTTDPEFTFSVYQQVATRRYIDEQAIWSGMRFADEPAERVKSRQLTRVDAGDPRGPIVVEKGPFDRFLEDLDDPGKATGNHH